MRSNWFVGLAVLIVCLWAVVGSAVAHEARVVADHVMAAYEKAVHE